MVVDTAYLAARIRSHCITDSKFSTRSLPDVEVIEFINAAQERMWQSSSEWRNLEQIWEKTLRPGSDEMALPANVIRVLGVYQKPGDAPPSVAELPSQMDPVREVTRRQYLDRSSVHDVSANFPRPQLSGLFYYVWQGKIFVGSMGGQQLPAITVLIDYMGTPPPLVLPPADPSLTADGPTTNYFTQMYPRTLKWGAISEALAFLDSHETARFVAADKRFEMLLERAKAVETQLRSTGDTGKRVRGV